MIDASREEFCDLAADGPAVVRGAAEMPAVEPLAAYAALAGEGPAFLLESGGEKIAASDPGTAFRPRRIAPDHRKQRAMQCRHPGFGSPPGAGCRWRVQSETRMSGRRRRSPSMGESI